MQIADFLAPDSVLAAVRAPDKRDILETLSKQAASILPLDEGAIFTALQARENLGSTGMGEGIALPHARLPAVPRPVGVFAQLRQPIDFDAIDSKPVDLVFLLLLPIDSKGEQLQALACVSRRLRDREVAKRLRSLREPAELFSVLAAD